MANNYFEFKKFTIHHDRCAMKVTTDACLFGAWIADGMRNWESGIRDHRSDQTSLLDIGCGSGLLSLIIAQKNPVMIDAVEIDGDAAAQANENIKNSLWADQINVFNKDVLQFHPVKKYHFIISNPPFYENELRGPDALKNVAHHSGGLLFPQLFDIIKKKLTEDGKFFVLLPYKRINEAELLLNKAELNIHKKVLVRTSINHEPTRVMIMGGRKKTEMISSMLEIKNGNLYSDEFIALLKDYYLHL